MKKKKKQELHNQSVSQLVKLADKTQVELATLQVDLGTGRLKDTSQVKKKRHDLARIKTIMRQKQLAMPAKTEEKES